MERWRVDGEGQLRGKSRAANQDPANQDPANQDPANQDPAKQTPSEQRNPKPLREQSAEVTH